MRVKGNQKINLHWRVNTTKVAYTCEVQQFESMKWKFLHNVLLNLEKRFFVDSTKYVVMHSGFSVSAFPKFNSSFVKSH